VFFAFDLLELDGEDVARLSQVERKARPEALLADLPADGPIHYSQHVVGNGQEVFDAMRQGGLTLRDMPQERRRRFRRLLGSAKIEQ
jgi:ATP-dependent DNA ligase